MAPRPQAAVYANVGVGFIRSLITKQRLRAIDLGRYYLIDREDLDACLQKLKSKPPTCCRRMRK